MQKKINMSYIHTIDVHNTKAAEEIIPYILKLLKPKSVLDIGCGIGTWLKIFKENGIDDFIGIDGEYVNRDLLYSNIEQKNFVAIDLGKEFNLNKKFDLAVSLEVAEHLPLESSDIFIESIIKHSDNILFSAAIPNQWGQNHLNEQWSDYWIEKFKNYGYNCFDIRAIFWENKNIEWWYKQNLFIFSKNNLNIELNNNRIINIIHPEHFEQKIQFIQNQKKLIDEKEEMLKVLILKQKSIKSLFKQFFSEIFKRIKNKFD